MVFEIIETIHGMGKQALVSLPEEIHLAKVCLGFAGPRVVRMPGTEVVLVDEIPAAMLFRFDQHDDNTRPGISRGVWFI